MEVEVEAIGVHESAEVFKRLAHRATHARPAMERLAREILVEERARLDAGAVKPLEASTIARKARDGEDPRPLRGGLRIIRGEPTRTADALFRALTVWRDKADGQVLSTRKDGLTFGLEHRGPTFYGRFLAKDRDLFPAGEWIARRTAAVLEDYLKGAEHDAPPSLF